MLRLRWLASHFAEGPQAVSDASARLDAAQRRLREQTPQSPLPVYLTAEEVAGAARCEVKAVRRAIHAGALRASRPNKRWLILPDDARAWIEARPASHTPRPPRRRRGTPGNVTKLREMERQAG